jgi:hypothetical protein
MIRNGVNNYLAKIPLIFNLYKLFYKKFDLIYNPVDLNWSYYNKIKDVDIELEHQIGRLTNFRDIIEVINKDKFVGDVVEFGCWKGFSLLWLAYLLERAGIFDKNIFAFDSFKGLPESDGVFIKDSFKNTSLKECKRNIFCSKYIYSNTKNNVIIYKNSFSAKEEIISKLKDRKFCLIHVDCDISSSAKEIFEILIAGDLIADRAYVVFDDYGCDTKLKETVDNIIDGLSVNWDIVSVIKTKLTKNYIFKRKKYEVY